MTLGPKDYVIGGLAVALALSGVGNWWLFNERDEGIAALAEVQGALTTANDAAKTCDESVRALQEAATQAQADAKPKIEAAASKNTTHTRKAQVILATPASKPDDVCRSAQDRAIQWLKDRP